MRIIGENSIKENTTERLDRVLKNTKVEDTAYVLEEYSSCLFGSKKSFSSYMRGKIAEKGMKQQDVFLSADISEGYGYKLISGEKRTRQRDTLLRIFLASHFTLEEANLALRLYEMPTLYSRFARDAVIIIAFNNCFYDIHALDDVLISNGMNKLYPCKSPE